jgi:hypothetical protein
MTRTYSKKAFPHRVLFDTGDGAQRGDDVKVVRRHTLRRLDARDIERKVGPDNGVYSVLVRDAAKTAAHFLGAPDEWTESKVGLLVREQKIIVYPETRTKSMLVAADARMDALIKERADAKPKPKPGDGKFTDSEIAQARQIAVASFRLLYNHRGSVHYTQGASRWQGIRERRRYADGRFPLYCDCSSAYSWCWWNALTNVDGMNTRDRINGSSWTAGYTGTLLSHGWRVHDRKPGDAVIYGRGFPGAHVAMVANNTNYVYSHGSESGPHYIPWNYRSDVMQVRRYL